MLYLGSFLIKSEYQGGKKLHLKYGLSKKYQKNSYNILFTIK